MRRFGACSLHEGGLYAFEASRGRGQHAACPLGAGRLRRHWQSSLTPLTRILRISSSPSSVQPGKGGGRLSFPAAGAGDSIISGPPSILLSGRLRGESGSLLLLITWRFSSWCTAGRNGSWMSRPEVIPSFPSASRRGMRGSVPERSEVGAEKRRAPSGKAFCRKQPACG